MRRLAIAGLLLALLPGAALSQARPATTHRFTPDHFFNTFSFAHPPVLTIRSGDRVITETFNSERLNAAGRPMATGPNPQTGPFFIEGAEPRDMLKVTFHRIETNRATSRS